MFSQKSLLRLLVLVVLVISFANVISSVLHSFSVSESLEVINQEVNQLLAEKDQLEADKEYKSTDEFVEQEARNKLNLALPGDTVVDFVSPGGDSSQNQTISASSQGQNIPSLWRNLLFGNLN